MSLNLALIVDKSDAFIAFQKDRLFSKWDIKSEDVKKINRFIEGGGITLFGGETVSLLELEDADGVKQLLEDIERCILTKTFNDKVSKGMIITSNVARTSTKKLEPLITKLGGRVLITATDRGEKLTISEKLLKEINLNTATRSFLLSYVGDDYESVIPLVKTISDLSPKQQHQISEEDIFVRLPQAPGSVPPWNLEQPLMNGDLTKTIDVFRRVSKHSHFLVVLAVLRNKMTAAYKISAIYDNNPRISDSDLATATGTNPKSLWAVKKHHKTYGTARLQRALQEIAKTEAHVKGGSGAPPMIQMELLLVRIGELLKK